MKTYFEKNGDYIIHEYNVIKKTLWISISFLMIMIVILLIINIIDQALESQIVELRDQIAELNALPDELNAQINELYDQSDELHDQKIDYTYSITFFIIIIWASAVSSAGLLKFGLLVGQKDFRFFFAKLLFQKGIDEQDSLKKIDYVINGIKSYNKFLNRRVNIHIKDIDVIVDKIVLNIENIDATIIKINDKMNEGKSNLLTELLKSYSIAGKQFLEDVTIRDRFNAIFPTMIALFPLMIFAIQLSLGNIDIGIGNQSSTSGK